MSRGRRPGTDGPGGDRISPGSELRATLGGVDTDGYATVETDGGVVRVPGGIPGEVVRIAVGSRGQQRLGEVVEVIQPSPHRTTPRCQHASECGGCAWQHIGYGEQLRLKGVLVAELLRSTLGARAPVIEPVIGMSVGDDGMPWGSRQKVSFVFGVGAGGRGFRMGHYARGSSRIMAVQECPVHSERGNRTAFALRDALARTSVAAAGPLDEGLLKRVIVRATADDQEVVALLIVSRNDKSLRSPVRKLLGSPDAPNSFSINEQERPGSDLVGRRTLRLEGPGHVRERALGASFLVSPDAFFQTNVQAAGRLLDLVMAATTGASPGSVLDLYSGSGLFAIPLAMRGHLVTAVEENRQAMQDAGVNARLNHVPEGRLRFMAMRVEDALPRLRRDRFETVLLDPPRQGCPASVLEVVVRQIAPPTLVYISCNPVALASELPGVLAAGYRIEHVQPLDMFPHTAHIEVVVVLKRAT